MLNFPLSSILEEASWGVFCLFVILIIIDYDSSLAQGNCLRLRYDTGKINDKKS